MKPPKQTLCLYLLSNFLLFLRPGHYRTAELSRSVQHLKESNSLAVYMPDPNTNSQNSNLQFTNSLICKNGDWSITPDDQMKEKSMSLLWLIIPMFTHNINHQITGNSPMRNLYKKSFHTKSNISYLYWIHMINKICQGDLCNTKSFIMEEAHYFIKSHYVT